MRFDGTVAIVTGSSRGIGRSVALLFAEHGACVVINCRERIANAEAVVRAIGRDRSVAIRADVSTEAGALQAAEAAIRAFGRIDVLVNNAGLIIREGDW